VNVAARFAGIGLLAALPVAGVAGFFATRLLARHDVNYYLASRPPEFTVAVVVIGAVALTTVGFALVLLVRWRWVLQALMFEACNPGEAFVRSAKLTRGIRWKLAGVLVGVSLVLLGLGAVASVIGDAATSVILGVAGQSGVGLAISFGLLLLLRTAIGAVVTFLGSWVDAGVFTELYRRRSEALGGKPTLNRASGVALPTRWLPATVVGGLLIFAGCGTWFALGAIWDERTLEIHAHRGVCTKAPENTLAAVREAIAAGADYVETDVQLSRDGVLVVAHDSDFSRLGGVATKVWELSYEEIRKIPLGRNAAPEFRNEITPTFDELLAETQGRVRVNIELKYYGDHQAELARKVVEAVRARGMLDQVIIQCLEYDPLLEVRQLAPEVPIGYLLSFNAREPARLEVDFLSVEQNRIDRTFILGAHRRGQQVYAWTVNTAEQLEHLYNLGVDGVITDDPALARRMAEEYFARPKSERAVRRIRAWLGE
jgi:glycerophosphoryl diester phosphodiesterase